MELTKREAFVLLERLETSTIYDLAAEKGVLPSALIDAINERIPNSVSIRATDVLDKIVELSERVAHLEATRAAR